MSKKKRFTSLTKKQQKEQLSLAKKFAKEWCNDKDYKLVRKTVKTLKDDKFVQAVAYVHYATAGRGEPAKIDTLKEAGFDIDVIRKLEKLNPFNYKHLNYYAFAKEISKDVVCQEVLLGETCNSLRLVIQKYSLNQSNIDMFKTNAEVRRILLSSYKNGKVPKRFSFNQHNEVMICKNNCNALLSMEALDDEAMENLGFTDKGNKWVYSKTKDSICIWCVVWKDGSEMWEFDVLDNEFCQPYDYQKILSDDPGHSFASKVYERVEEVLGRWTKAGLLKGHVKGEYV